MASVGPSLVPAGNAQRSSLGLQPEGLQILVFNKGELFQLRKNNQDAFVKRHGIKMGFMSAFVKASAYALQKQPTVNAVIDGQETVYRDYVDISVAVATPKVCPVYRLCRHFCG